MVFIEFPTDGGPRSVALHHIVDFWPIGDDNAGASYVKLVSYQSPVAVNMPYRVIKKHIEDYLRKPGKDFLARFGVGA